MFLVLWCWIRIRGNSLFCDCLDMHRERENADKPVFFLIFNLSHQLQLLIVQDNYCSVMCYTVLIWTLILLTVGNNILLQSFNWPEPVNYVPTDKINASICIRIWQILKVRIRIQTNANFYRSHHCHPVSLMWECMTLKGFWKVSLLVDGREADLHVFSTVSSVVK